MPITERTLRKWRREALEERNVLEIAHDSPQEFVKWRMAVNDRILRMTRELMDYYLLRKRGDR